MFKSLHGHLFEELFVTARQDRFDIMCGLHNYEKCKYESTGETNFHGDRPIPED